MNNLLSSIYIDYSRNIWRFTLDEDNNLCYKVMYEEGGWDKETIIDRGVLSFSVYVNEDEVVNIIYSNNKNEIKYCTMRNMKWVGKVVYKLDEEEGVLTNIKIIINKDIMHIFFITREHIGGKEGVINHFIWDGENVNNRVIQEIELMKNLREYYYIVLNNNGEIDLFFLDDEGEEVTLNRCTFINGKWTAIKKMYGIQGNDIEFEVILEGDNIYVLNKYKEDDKYFLEYVVVNMMEEIREYNIYSSENEPIDSKIIFYDKKMYCFWVEEDKIYYSQFSKNRWSEEKLINISEATGIKGDNCFIWSNKEECIKKIKIYITNENKMNIFIPSKYLLSVRTNKDKSNEIVYSVKSLSRSLKKELMRVRVEKKQLESNVSYLNMKLKKRQNQLLEYKENLNLVLQEKKKVDESCKIFLEIQEKNRCELENVMKKLEKEKEDSGYYVNTIEKLKSDLLEKEEVILEKEELIKNLRKKVDKLMNELEMEKEDKKLIKKALEIERNQSIMDRILRRKSNDI